MSFRKRYLLLLPFMALLILVGYTLFLVNHEHPHVNCRHGHQMIEFENFHFKDDFSAGFEKVNFPDELEKPLKVALSYFPELKDIDIDISYASISTTMNCRPVIASLFQSKTRYQMQINNNELFDGILLKDVPFNAQVGILGHELAHVLDYETGGFFKVVKRGIDYLRLSSKKQFEHEIDSITIATGLGWQVMDFADFAMNRSEKATEAYKNFKKDIYMSPEKMMELLNEFDCY